MSINRKEEYQKLRAMEKYHWTSIQSFWEDNQANDQILEKIIAEKQKFNKMLNDFQISLMQANTNKQKTKDLTFMIGVIYDK